MTFKIIQQLNDFEKALEAAAIFYWQDKLAKFFPTSTGPTDLEKDMFRQGAIWSRQFTIEEVCEWLKTNFETTDKSAANWYAQKIKQHFKGRGTK